MQIKQNEGSRECDALWLNSSVRLCRCGCCNSADDSLRLLPPPQARCFRHCAVWQDILRNFIAKHLLFSGISPLLPSLPSTHHSWVSYPWGLVCSVSWGNMVVFLSHTDVEGSPSSDPKIGWKSSDERINPTFHCTPCSNVGANGCSNVGVMGEFISFFCIIQKTKNSMAGNERQLQLAHG